jgi:hypothetical protein
MPNFIPYNLNQNTMVVINFHDQIQPGTFEHALHYLIEHKLDLSVFDPEYSNDDAGRPAYDPAVLLKIILFAYSKGITSSRLFCSRSFCSRTLKALLPAARSSGAARTISCSRPCPATPFPISLQSLALSVASRCRLNRYSSRCCWCATIRACWGMNSLRLMAASCRATPSSSGRVPSRSWRKSARS